MAAEEDVPKRSVDVSTFVRWSRRITIIGWFSVIAFVIWGITSGVLTSITRLREFLNGFGHIAPTMYSLLGATEAVFPLVPGSVTIIAAPILFGPVVGFFCAYAGTVLGSSAVFAISRHVGQDLLATKFKPSTIKRYLGWIEDRRFPMWFAIAIALPIAPDDLLCYLAGLTGMRWRTFLLIILLLKPITLLAYVFGVITLLGNWFPWLTP